MIIPIIILVPSDTELSFLLKRRQFLLRGYYVIGWEDNIERDLREIGCEEIDWIQLAQDRHQCQAFWNMY